MLQLFSNLGLLQALLPLNSHELLPELTSCEGFVEGAVLGFKMGEVVVIIVTITTDDAEVEAGAIVMVMKIDEPINDDRANVAAASDVEVISTRCNMNEHTHAM